MLFSSSRKRILEFRRSLPFQVQRKRFLHGKNFVANQLLPFSRNENSSTFFAYNPRSGEKLDPIFIEATENEIIQTLEGAREAFLSYKNKSSEEVSIFLRNISLEIQSARDSIVKRAMMETNFPEKRLLEEMQRTLDQINIYDFVFLLL
jgi:acyl-CoA reductase-like NAD-dependent aldehyde dehydrogenase